LADATTTSGMVCNPLGRGARWAVLWPIVALLAFAVSAALAGCAGSPRPAPPTPSVSGAASALVMVIRHGEKPDDSHPGVDAQGKEDDSSLTETGWERANRLADLFDPASGSLRPGLATPKAIYAAGANDEGEGLRPRQTVMPLVARLGLTMNTSYGAGDEKKLVQRVITQPGPTLISWQHGGIPDIAKAFPAVTPKPPSDWPDDRFDIVWTFTRTADGWQFAQVPELLLAGDQDAPIKN
jgi:broad specificity phosphatase PhoE